MFVFFASWQCCSIGLSLPSPRSTMLWVYKSGCKESLCQHTAVVFDSIMTSSGGSVRSLIPSTLCKGLDFRSVDCVVIFSRSVVGSTSKLKQTNKLYHTSIDSITLMVWQCNGQSCTRSANNSKSCTAVAAHSSSHLHYLTVKTGNQSPTQVA